MPWTVAPKYIANLRDRYYVKFGRISTLHDADISELVNIYYSGNKLSHDEEAALTVVGMAEKEIKYAAPSSAAAQSRP